MNKILILKSNESNIMFNFFLIYYFTIISTSSFLAYFNTKKRDIIFLLRKKFVQ